MKYRSIIAKVLAVSILSTSCFAPMAQAALVGTETVISQQQVQDNRTRLNEVLQRDDLTAKLQAAGVSPADVQARVDLLSDQEVATLVDQFDQLPAGGDFLGVAVFIFVVLLITDILGYTDIFPFVKK